MRDWTMMAMDRMMGRMAHLGIKKEVWVSYDVERAGGIGGHISQHGDKYVFYNGDQRMTVDCLCPRLTDLLQAYMQGYDVFEKRAREWGYLHD